MIERKALIFVQLKFTLSSSLAFCGIVEEAHGSCGSQQSDHGRYAGEWQPRCSSTS